MLVELTGRVVEEFHVFIALVSKKAAQFADVLVSMRKVGRAEVLIERLVDEFLQQFGHFEMEKLSLTLSMLKKNAWE